MATVDPGPPGPAMYWYGKDAHMSKTHHTLLMLSLALTLLLGGGVLVGCEDQGPAEEAGEQIDETAEEAGDAMDDAADEVEESVDQ